MTTEALAAPGARTPSAPAPTLGRVARFAAPMVLGNAVTLGAQFAVVALLGAMGGDALYVRSVYAPVSFVLLAVNVGLSITAQVGTARRAGRGELGSVAGALTSVARIGIPVYAVCGAVLAACSPALTALLSVPERDRTPFLLFLLAMVGVSLLGFLGELCAAGLRGTGATGAGVVLTLTSVALTLGGVGALGLAAGWGLAALPVSTAVAAVAELGVGIVLLRRSGLLAGGLAASREQRGQARALALSIGAPVAGSYLLLFVVNLALLRIIASHGVGAVAGFTLGYTLQSAVIVPAVGFGSAIAILVNQHLAAGRPALARQAVRTGAALVLLCYAVTTAIVVPAGPPLVRSLAHDPAVAREAARFLTLVGPTFGCTALALTALSLLEQTGRGLVAVSMNVVYFGGIVGVGAWLASARHSTDGLYLTMTVGAAAGAVFCWLALWALLHRPLTAAAAAALTGAGPEPGPDPDHEPEPLPYAGAEPYPGHADPGHAGPERTGPGHTDPEHTDPERPVESEAATVWATEPVGPAHHPAVLDLFTDPDFHFRGAAHPEFLAEAEVLALLGDDSQVLTADGALVGLHAAETVGTEHGGHWQVHLRLRAGQSAQRWKDAYEEVFAGLRDRNDVVRITVTVGEYDVTGQKAARAVGLLPEGTLESVVLHDGERSGTAYFSRVWEPEPAAPERTAPLASEPLQELT